MKLQVTIGNTTYKPNWPYIILVGGGFLLVGLYQYFFY